MIQTQKVLTLLFLIGMLTACQSMLTGQLVDESNQPVYSADARINIVSLANNETRSVIVTPVERDGRFKVDVHLDKGKYLIEALVPGYHTASTRLQLNKAKNIKIVLRPIKKSSVKTVEFQEGLHMGRGAGDAKIMPPKL